jgi:hypothetical protein
MRKILALAFVAAALVAPVGAQAATSVKVLDHPHPFLICFDAGIGMC